MKLEQLEYIVEIANCGSLTKASEKLHVTLSAVSQSLSTLENELQITIFHRSRQGTVPTGEGKKILEKANQIIQLMKEMESEVENIQNELTGQLRIATIPSPMHLFVSAVSDFKKVYPKVDIDIFEGGSKDILSDLLQDRIDIGVLILYEKVLDKLNGLTIEKLRDCKMVVGVPSNSPLATQKSIPPEQLLQYPLVVYRDDFILWYLNNIIARYGKPDVLFNTNNTVAIHNAVKDGALTFGLDYSFQDHGGMNESSMVTIDLDIANFSFIQLGIVHMKNRYMSPAVSKFIKLLQEKI
ncbi:LysR family transcriptional regulator [Viridibacillus arvi]|uniref:LysR family transcriptional regulator n=1 Tax=Viridibacillus arvi TaxID=263475 RepID=UPI00187B4FDF|nr:LysR family transcriptional regulator [Viridibacillus sp. JNUCC-6]QOV11337.1 LysR family transcriptional regulator [Viridibacillus sp. JNUCC-6]